MPPASSNYKERQASGKPAGISKKAVANRIGNLANPVSKKKTTLPASRLKTALLILKFPHPWKELNKRGRQIAKSGSRAKWSLRNIRQAKEICAAFGLPDTAWQDFLSEFTRYWRNRLALARKEPLLELLIANDKDLLPLNIPDGVDREYAEFLLFVLRNNPSLKELPLQDVVDVKNELARLSLLGSCEADADIIEALIGNRHRPRLRVDNFRMCRRARKERAKSPYIAKKVRGKRKERPLEGPRPVILHAGSGNAPDFRSCAVWMSSRGVESIEGNHDVHHLDFDPFNDDPENLMLLWRWLHKALHVPRDPDFAEQCRKWKEYYV